MNDITIAGKLLSLKLMEHTELKGVFTDALLRYSFYKTGGQGNTFVLLQPKKDRKLSPLPYKNMADRIGSVLDRPCVFAFTQLATYTPSQISGQVLPANCGLLSVN